MEILNFLFCDDIRAEVGNKFSMMGVYNETVNFNVTRDKKDQWPKSTRIGLYAQLKFEEEEKESEVIYFEIVIEQNGKNKLLIEALLPKDDSQPEKQGVIIHALFDKFKFDGPGKIKFTFIFKDKDKSELYRVCPKLEMNVQETIIK